VRITTCRACGAPVDTAMVDLGTTPLANSYLRPEDLDREEPAYPLRAVVCGECLLVQLDEQADAEAIFSDYAYFSSYSASWLAHARRYADAVIERFGLDGRSQVVEIASNDGYLLQNFVRQGIPALGIEPAANVAAVAVAAGIPTQISFFGSALASQLADAGTRADLIAANNVLAHVPQLNDFVEGIRLLLKPGGVATFEFPHLLRLMAERQFDTIYHEHFCYFSLLAVSRVFAAHGLRIFDVEQLPTHGGSLRLFVQHENGPHQATGNVERLIAEETTAGLRDLATYRAFGRAVEQVRDDLLAFLRAARTAGQRVAAYGAPAKGNTLLNYCGVTTDLIELTVDLSPHKQNHYLPGTRIPIHDPQVLRDVRPDFVLVLPWNLRDEIVSQMAWIAEWGGRFVVPIPSLTVLAPADTEAAA
jgi:SAM-dependent methyltransferase